jgi:hypothetical protein
MDSNPVSWSDLPADLAPFVSEILLQISAAESAFRSLERNLEVRKDLGKRISEIDRAGGPQPLELEQRQYGQLIADIANIAGPILGDIQSFLAAVGIISDVLWPSPLRRKGVTTAMMENRVARGARIRLTLSVSEESSLRIRTGGSEDARGDFLHFDQMVEEYSRTHPGPTLVTFDIGSSATGTDVDRSRAIRRLDEDSLDLWVKERSSNLRGLLQELRQISSRIRFRWSVGFTRSTAPRGPAAIPIGVAITVVPGHPDSPSKSEE